MPNVKWRSRARSLVLVLVAAMTLGVTTAAAQTLKAGSRGSAVAALQKELRIPADGAYGPQTQRAVRRFQRAHRLTVDGIAGPATLSALGLTAVAARTTSSVGVGAALDAIARCESGGNPRAVSPGGTYRGKYQFDRPTWRTLGGKGDPARAREAVQDRIAAKLYARAGSTPWPNCA